MVVRRAGHLFASRVFLKIFFVDPHHTGCATGRENFLYRTFCGKIFSWTMRVFFCPVGAGIFLAGNPFLEIFCERWGLFQHLKRYFYIYPLMFIELTPKKGLSGLQRAIKQIFHKTST